MIHSEILLDFTFPMLKLFVSHPCQRREYAVVVHFVIGMR